MKKIVILGSTGSIGTQALEVIDEQKDNFQAFGLVGGSNVELLISQAKKFQPKWVGIQDESKYQYLKENLPTGINVVAGEKAIEEIISDSEYQTLLAAVSGIAGLKSTIKGIEAGKEIALANKETLVAGGNLIMNLVKKHGVNLLPVDSEHSAIFQSMNNHQRKIKRIILTASGGPFRDYDEEMLSTVKIEDALKHPNWSMGKKITIDSATLANKALEVIEAHYLFDCAYENIDILIHKESIIHSMVEFIDTSIIAQLGFPSMKLPIQYAFTHPNSLPVKWPSLDLADIGSLNFSKPKAYFRALSLGVEAGKAGGSAPIIFNGANEIAVDYFVNGKISFLQIAELIETALNNVENIKINSFEDIAYIDKATRDYLKKEF
ncbi:MAG: 1-deoxy-D-xylulose-5-phosphate reductoisomerase [Fusobacteria bacterium]|nr:MAG: 1-deoxy-D-xylulose-5-phosphate reductoisomerase [Fusobacteriota bacterium]KAF0229960.1 MAG: 1-deoxy-D-xylulose-5-phosphate [Fusobacteriota bacterium]